MEHEISDLPFFKLSDSQDLILFLISKELQGAKFMRELDRLGFDQSVFCLDLGSVIMSLVGLKNRNDELWEWYMKVLDSYSQRVDLLNTENTHDLALEFYQELRAKRNFAELD